MSSIPFSQRVLCTIDEACEAIGCGRSKAYEWIKAGRLRTVRPDGGRQYVTVESVLELAKLAGPAA